MSVRLQVLEYSRAEVHDGVIQGVKIIGTRSSNGRVYPQEVLSAHKHLYEGAGVFLFHPRGAEKRKGSRQLADHFGSLSNVHERWDGKIGLGLFGDLRIKQSHPMAQFVLENAGKHRFGLSHNAVVEIGDDQIVTRILEVNSVDLVDDPATTTNLFEESNEMELKELQQVMEEKFNALHDEIKGLKAAAETKAAPPEVKPPRIAVLEKIEAGEPTGSEYGTTHEDFLAGLRGVKKGA